MVSKEEASRQHKLSTAWAVHWLDNMGEGTVLCADLPAELLPKHYTDKRQQPSPASELEHCNCWGGRAVFFQAVTHLSSQPSLPHLLYDKGICWRGGTAVPRGAYRSWISFSFRCISSSCCFWSSCFSSCMGCFCRLQYKTHPGGKLCSLQIHVCAESAVQSVQVLCAVNCCHLLTNRWGTSGSCYVCVSLPPCNPVKLQ